MASSTPAGPPTAGREPPAPEALPSVAENGTSHAPAAPSSAPPVSPAAGASQQANNKANVNDNNDNNNNNNSRRTSLGFLRRPKSTEPLGDRKPSKMSKRQMKEQAREAELKRHRDAAAVPKVAPKLPDLAPPPQLNTFGGEAPRPDSVAIVSNRAGKGQHVDSSVTPQRGNSAPPPNNTSNAKSGEHVDPYARTESMTHRGRYSYASSAVSTINSPRKVRRRKDPTPYNVLVMGAKNSGKTAFLNFLRTSLALPPSKRPTRPPDELDDLPQTSSANSKFTCHYLETEIENERVGLTLWDSEGMQKNIVDLQLREATAFLESKFEDTFAEEMKVIRSPGVRDTHIHCIFLVLDPARLDANITTAQKASSGEPDKDATGVIGALDEELDLQVLRTILGKSTVLPIISKADTITTAHMAYLKKVVWDGLKKASIDPLEVLTLEGQDDESTSGSLDKFDENEEDNIHEEDEQEQDGEGEAAGQQPKDETQQEAEEKQEGEGGQAAEENREEAEEPSAEAETTSKQQPSERPPPAPSASSPKAGTGAGHSKRKSISSLSSRGDDSGLPLIPLSILSPDPHSLQSKDEPVGRRFPWGFADPYNPEHCDFLKIKESVFGEWRGELREASREVWYERWRTTRLNYNGTLPTRGRGNPRNGRNGTRATSSRQTR